MCYREMTDNVTIDQKQADLKVFRVALSHASDVDCSKVIWRQTEKRPVDQPLTVSAIYRHNKVTRPLWNYTVTKQVVNDLDCKHNPVTNSNQRQFYVLDKISELWLLHSMYDTDFITSPFKWHNNRLINVKGQVTWKKRYELNKCRECNTNQ